MVQYGEEMVQGGQEVASKWPKMVRKWLKIVRNESKLVWKWSNINKNAQEMVQIVRKLSYMDWIDLELSEIVPNGTLWSNMVQYGLKWYKTVWNGPKWSETDQDSLKWSQKVQDSKKYAWCIGSNTFCICWAWAPKAGRPAMKKLNVDHPPHLYGLIFFFFVIFLSFCLNPSILPGRQAVTNGSRCYIFDGLVSLCFKVKILWRWNRPRRRTFRGFPV